jgi:hypothetical protein
MNDSKLLWAHLSPDPAIEAALLHAGVRPTNGGQDAKRHWSERFANACAVAIANQFRSSALKGKNIRPVSLETGTEPLTPLGSGTSKRIDVTIADPLLGLEIGVSLKGLNFKDGRAGNFDKNLTGRLYELGDEMRLVHEHLPHAFMAGIFFLPLQSTADKTVRANSSFANTVTKLRERTGRLDAALLGHAQRCDIGFVALYTTGEEPEGYSPGVTRFFNVNSNPPRRDRPKVAETLSLAEVVDECVLRATFTSKVQWSEPE